MTEILMVIAQSVFRDEEYAQPKAIFERRGAHVTTASEEAGPATGRFGLVATADIALEDADPDDYDAVVFVGGGGAEVFFDDPAAHEVARSAYESGKVVAAICIAPSTLARAGLLDGRRATAFPSQQNDLILRGAVWTGQSVTVDAPFVTGNGPEAAREFGEAVADLVGL
ncbi:MAG TPA: DJ-1/PfpI family protein [Coriobacteriia bacterium]